MKNKNSKKHFWFLVWGLGNGNCAEILKMCGSILLFMPG